MKAYLVDLRQKIINVYHKESISQKQLATSFRRSDRSCLCLNFFRQHSSLVCTLLLLYLIQLRTAISAIILACSDLSLITFIMTLLLSYFKFFMALKHCFLQNSIAFIRNNAITSCTLVIGSIASFI